MCRFYALRASAPTAVECCLVAAPNSLLTQSRRDMRGFEHADGWGSRPTAAPAAVRGGRRGGLGVERHADPAHDGCAFVPPRRASPPPPSWPMCAARRSARSRSRTPTRSATPAGSSCTTARCPYFAEIRDALLAELPAAHRSAIAGSTDSEHLFHFILARHEQAPERPLLATLQQALERVIGWCRARGQEPHLGLNVLLSDGTRMVGSRWQRSLHWCARAGRAACPVCGRPDAAGATDGYRALLIASEPITAEPWPEVPERSVFEVTPDLRLHVLPLAAG